MSNDLAVPKFRQLMAPTLNALQALGGSARIDEISAAVIEMLGLSEEQQALRQKDHHTSLIDYRLAWARNYLKNIGAIENSARGVWSITEHGRTLTPERIDDEVREWKAAYNKTYLAAKRTVAESSGTDDGDADDDVEPPEIEWKEALLGALQSMPPDAFERLAQRLLREANFRNVEVLGKSGDGGLDGVGVYRLSLVSFSGLLPVQALCGLRWTRCCAGFPRRHGRERRERPSHHNRNLHTRCSG